jgi:hypothetical protein
VYLNHFAQQQPLLLLVSEEQWQHLSRLQQQSGRRVWLNRSQLPLPLVAGSESGSCPTCVHYYLAKAATDAARLNRRAYGPAVPTSRNGSRKEKETGMLCQRRVQAYD